MWFYDERQETSVGRAAGGLVVGSATGTVATLIGFLIAAVATADNPFSALASAPVGLLLAIPVFIVWMIGAFTVGAAGWAVLHALCLRGPLTGATWVGVSTFLVATLMTGGRTFDLPAIIGVAGIVAGLATWKFSYRRPAPPVNEVFA